MIMADDATPEDLWQRLAEESPHTSDDEIERLFIALPRTTKTSFGKSPSGVFNNIPQPSSNADGGSAGAKASQV
jgi:hypothetical protein